MNLPVVNERVDISNEAENTFSIRLSEEVFNKYKPTYDERINIYSQCIINLTKERGCRLFINRSHKIIEDIFIEVTSKYNLTYGEKVKILTSKIQDDVISVIRWERHNDISKNGDTV